MKYEFLVESYETELVKVLSVWSEFRDGDLPRSLLPLPCGEPFPTRLFAGLRAVVGRKHVRR